MTIPTIVTLAQAQAHLRISPMMSMDSPPQPLPDQDLQQKIDAATQLVCEHISDRQPADPDWITEIESWNTAEDSPANPAPPLVVLAVLELTADLYRFRGDDAGDDRGREAGFLPMPVRNLLVRYRDPVLS